MHLRISLLALTLLLSAPPAFSGAKIDPALSGFAHGDATHETALVLAVLDAPSSFSESKPERYDTRNVLKFLRGRAKAAWSETGLSQSDAVHLVRLYWINTSASVRVTPEGLKALAEAPGVKKIYANHKMRMDRPGRIRHHGFAESEARNAYDFADIGLDQLIKEAPSITGKGITVGSVDTGVDGKHPALEGKIALFYDSAEKKIREPYDSDEHGSHTAGTILGGDRDKNKIGMAPDARLIASGPLNDFDGMLRSMEFMLDPDGNPSTKDMPRAINNSWNCGGAPDIELFYKAISAWEAAGILPVFSAGNAGPGAGTITPPHEHPSVIAIGATGPDGKIASFSSRGPGRFHDKETQKPDITAPGVDIYSSVPGGKYATMSGTSMAAPHVTGAVALVLQVEPSLTPIQIRKVLMKTATATKSDDTPGAGGDWNATYGFGKLNIYRAAKMAKEIRNSIEGVLEQDLTAQLFKSPHDVDLMDIMTPSGAITDRDLEFPTELETSDWVTADQVWTK